MIVCHICKTPIRRYRAELVITQTVKIFNRELQCARKKAFVLCEHCNVAVEDFISNMQEVSYGSNTAKDKV